MTTAEFLLLNGAKVDIRDNNGQGPLHHATQLGHTGYAIHLLMVYEFEMLKVSHTNLLNWLLM